MSQPAPLLPWTTPRRPARAVLFLAHWAAIFGRVGELILRRLAQLFLTEPVFAHPYGFWLGPLSALLLFAPVILIVWGLTWRIGGRTAAWRAAVWTAAWLAVFDVLLLVPRFHVWALAVFAAGVAALVARFAMARPPLFRKVMVAGSLVLALIAGVVGPLTTRRAQPPSGPEGTPRRGAPSVLLLVLDTVRALELSGLGYQRPTSPALDALARSGVQFQRAVATAPWTLPSHAALFTGRFQHELSVGWSTPLGPEPLTLAQHVVSQGYATGGFTANLRYTARNYGLDRGFQEYRDYSFVHTLALGMTMFGRLVTSFYNQLAHEYVMPGRKDAAQVVDEFLAWREDQGDQPYFAFLNFFDAHDPYAPPPPYDLRFRDTEPLNRSVEIGVPHSAEEVRGLQDSYDGAVAYLDAEIGRLVEALRADGSLDRTLIIVTSDHGEEFAEHGHLGHGSGLHFPAIHVPLIVRWPEGGVPGGVTVEDAVSIVDVPATILDLIGDPTPQALPGASLAPLWRGESPSGLSPVLSELYWAPNQPESYPVAGGDLHSLVRGRWHLIAGPGTSEELYDIMADPFERHDLAAVPELADTLRSLRESLAAFPMLDRGGR